MRSLKIFKFIGPGLLVTVGFIDPGNWASNISGGSQFGYQLLWVITLGTLVLILLQHNVAHLGIVTGKCLSESISEHFSKTNSKLILTSAILANISVALAEILGIAIALQMLFGINLKLGAIIGASMSLLMIFTNTYKKLEKIIVGFVSIIGFSFIFELSLIDFSWAEAFKASIVPTISRDSLFIAMGIFGAIVMPHNLFLHSEVIQSRKFSLEGSDVIETRLKYEFFDTLFSMILGWVINCAMIILSMACFFNKNIVVTELQQAQELLKPLLGEKAAIVFAIGLFFAGFSSSITAGMAAGTVSAGMNCEEYDIRKKSSKIGVVVTIGVATIIIFFVKDILGTLILSQAILCFQLPITVASQLYLTSNKKIMGKYKNSLITSLLIAFTCIFITILNFYLIMR